MGPVSVSADDDYSWQQEYIKGMPFPSFLKVIIVIPHHCIVALLGQTCEASRIVVSSRSRDEGQTNELTGNVETGEVSVVM